MGTNQGSGGITREKKDVKIISISVAIDSHVRSLAAWSLHVPPVAVWVVFGTPASSHSTKTRTVR